MIEVKNLVKTYGPNRAVDGISFAVDKGQIVGFLGPNGAGKSTTMKMLTCFIAPDGGEARVAGCDVLKDSLGARRAVGYMPENTPLYEDMGVVEFLRFIAAMRSLGGARTRERIDYVIQTCGLRGVVGKLIGQLSRGYRQRVSLAQALLHDPDILILDEPTSALDPKQIIEIRELIKNIGKTKTILLSTHIMQEVSATCDRAIIISRGRIVAQGPLDELTGGGKGRPYRAVVHCPAPALQDAARALPGVITASASAVDGNGTATLNVTFNASNAEPAESIYALVRDRGWVLRELRENRRTLEEVFIEVTQQA